MKQKKMRAAIFHGPKDIRVETIDIPTLNPDWVLLKVHAAGVCGSDLHLYKEKTEIPISSTLGEGKYIPGHELSGEVVEIGSDVDSIEIGTRVGVEPIIGCGHCKWCNIGKYNLCVNYKLIGFQYPGGFAEYCAVPEEKCLVLPDNVSYEAGATLDCIAVAEHAIRRANIGNEDAVAIFGAGSIGLFAVQAAIAAGARKIYSIGTHDFQLEMARELGASIGIHARKEDPVERINDLTSGFGVDKVVEAVGGETTVVNDAIRILRNQGTLVVTGIFVKPIPVDLFGMLTKELTITTAWGYEHWSHRKEFEVSLDLLASGKITADRLVTHKYPLDEVNKAYETAIDKSGTESVKVQISFPD
ncbi:hypothetical protein EU537_08840 [Candidatus Thorarchaeota archaeon]|nr:MAG: hypothetical protein EU537_08840 [Candidatus Thorarchaeota archaeon]